MEPVAIAKVLGVTIVATTILLLLKLSCWFLAILAAWLIVVFNLIVVSIVSLIVHLKFFITINPTPTQPFIPMGFWG